MTNSIVEWLFERYTQTDNDITRLLKAGKFNCISDEILELLAKICNKELETFTINICNTLVGSSETL